jgi:hypothetical protein
MWSDVNNEMPRPAMNDEMPRPAMNDEMPRPAMNDEMPRPAMNDENNESSSTTPTNYGYIYLDTIGWKYVEYSSIKGLAIFEGDIILGTVEEMEKIRTQIETSPEAVAIPGRSHRWELGIIPFEINQRLPINQQQAINSAIQHWHRNTIIRFVQRTNQGDFVRFEPHDDECNSPVGRQGGRQPINLSENCGISSIIHEIGHTVGLWHEQSREDRDKFVKINWQNIESGKSHNFDQHIYDGDDIGRYDYCSIMHYRRNAWGKVVGGVKLETIVPLNPIGSECSDIGISSRLSRDDITAVREMYAARGSSVFVKISSQSIQHKWQARPNGEWSEWESLGGIALSDPAIVHNGANGIEVFVRGTDGAVWHNWQDRPYIHWSGWNSLGGVILGGIAAQLKSSGGIQIFVRGTNSAIYTKWQDGKMTGWSEWVYLGGYALSDPTVVLNGADGSEVFVRGTDGAVWHRWQDRPNGNWSGWESLGGVIDGNIAAQRKPDRGIELFVKGRDGALYTKWQSGRMGNWSGWESLGGNVSNDPVAIINRIGRYFYVS